MSGVSPKGMGLMREKIIEQKLVTETRKAGGLALKFVSPGFAGVPDRIVLMHGGCVAFVEVKAPGKKPRALQRSRHALLRRMGFRVYVLDDVDEIPRILAAVKGEADEIHSA